MNAALSKDFLSMAEKKNLSELAGSMKHATFSFFLLQFYCIPDSITIREVDGSKVAKWAWSRHSDGDIYSHERNAFFISSGRPDFQFASVNLGNSILIEITPRECTIYFDPIRRKAALEFVEQIVRPAFRND